MGNQVQTLTSGQFTRERELLGEGRRHRLQSQSTARVRVEGMSMNLDLIQQRIRTFRDERDWMQFHNPKNLAISICLEASELLEHFQWKTFEESERHAVESKAEIADEVADVAVYLIELCDNLGIDLEFAILSKLQKNAAKYPAAKSRGSAKKYTDL